MTISDSVTIRPVRSDELEAVAYIRAMSFGSEPQEALARLKSNPRYDFSHIIVALYNEEIIGTTTLFPAKMWLSGVPISVGAVAGVATTPAYRRNGVAAKMMRFAVTRMFNEDHALSILFPFSHTYYNKFDYGAIGDAHAYRLTRDNLIDFEEANRVRPFTPDDLPMMRVLHKGQMTWHNGWFVRSEEWWRRLIEHWSQVVVFDNDDLIEGYCAYEIQTEDNGERILNIIEFFAGDGPAYRGLIGYLAAQNEADVIKYLAPPHTPLRHLLRQPAAYEAQNRGWIFNDLCHVTPGPMGRIINLPKALTTRFYTRTMSGERVIKINDPLIPANEEPLLFRVFNGRPETHPADGREPHIETDIRTFSQILCGYLTATDAQHIGRLKAGEGSCTWLDQIIADSPLYIQAGDWF